MSSTPGYRAPAVARAFALLEAVAQAGRPIGLSDLSIKLGLSKSTVHGLVNALTRAGALVRASGTKKLLIGPLVHQLAATSFNWPKLTARLQPRLQELCHAMEHTVCLGLIGKSDHLILASAEPEATIKITAAPGTRLPMLAGALGKLLLAAMPEQQARLILESKGLPRFTSHGPASIEQYLDQLQQVRQKGYAIDRQEYLPGVMAVAVRLEPCSVPGLALWCVGLASAFGNQDLDRLGSILLARRKELAFAIEDRPARM